MVAAWVGTALRSSWLGVPLSTDAMAALPPDRVPTFNVPVYSILHLMIFL